MDKHELITKINYHLERITAEEQALSLPGLKDNSRKEIIRLYRQDTKEINRIIELLDSRPFGRRKDTP